MKRLVIFLALISLGILGLVAQYQREYIDQDSDRLMMVDGNVIQIKDNNPTLLQSRLTLCDGTIVNPNGTYLTKDLKKFHLHDGECLDNHGVVYRNEYQYRFKIEQENKGLTPAKIEKRNKDRFQLVSVDGDIFQIINISQKQIREKVVLKNGTVVSPNGNYRTPNGRVSLLIDGECLNMEGEMFHSNYTHKKIAGQKVL